VSVCQATSASGERCCWPEGHPEAVVEPMAARDRRGHLVEHSWALPPLWPVSMGGDRVEWARPFPVAT
jgi:hypothetical protein